jgi:hypothetical protein
MQMAAWNDAALFGEAREMLAALALSSTEMEADGKDRRLQRVYGYMKAASLNLRAACVGYRLALRLSEGREEEVTSLLGGDYDTLEHAAMSLAVEDVITALDLCASALAASIPATENAARRGPASGAGANRQRSGDMIRGCDALLVLEAAPCW